MKKEKKKVKKINKKELFGKILHSVWRIIVFVFAIAVIVSMLAMPILVIFG